MHNQTAVDINPVAISNQIINVPQSYISLNSLSTENIDCARGHSVYDNSRMVQEVLQNIRLEEIQTYPYPILREDLIDLLSMTISPNFKRCSVFFGHGCNHLLERIFAYLYPGKHLLGVGPQFVHVIRHCLSHRGQYTCINRDHKCSDFPSDNLIYEINKNGADYDILYIDNPNNPTGSSVDLEILIDIISVCEKKNITVIIDEAFGDFLPGAQSAVNVIDTFDNLIVLRGFSKFYGLAGMRIGCMVTSLSIAKEYSNFDQPFEPSTLTFKMAIAAMMDNVYIENTKETVISLKSKLIEYLQDSNIDFLPTDYRTSILTLYHPNLLLFDRLLELGIGTEPGEAFEPTHKKFSNHFVRFRLPKNDQLLKIVIEKLKSVELPENK